MKHMRQSASFASDRWLAAGLVVVLFFGAACTLLNPVREPYVPHPRQRVWVDEAAVINLVTRLVYDARFASRQVQAEANYAALLRYWYRRCSAKGNDIDGGIRALNYIRKIHFDAGGNRKLWARVVSRAREPMPKQRGMPVPPEFK